MGEQKENIEKKSGNNSSNIVPFAMSVGLITSFITRDMSGGLTGVQGFFVGVFAVFFLLVLAEIIDKYQFRKSEQNQIQLNIPEDMFITRAENEEGTTIKLFLSKKPH
jgi:hypothetical protein